MPRGFALIIEDDELFAGVVSGYLRELGYGLVARVASSIDAMAAVSGKEPDLIVADIILDPTAEDGAVIAQRLRRYRDIPLVVVSSRPELATHLPRCVVLNKRELSRAALDTAVNQARELVTA